ncbi:restriction system-associated AAA family ATPase [Pseudomonas aeruginosa]|uniref:restriction system-associated AAA family ATPase n=1 Tax=Pseudomonas aeruginosa TaxID=287 RepID=UPI0009A2CF35|nr:restriction system-associated AAA family ATPase [Pseudomonas aeruginosa]SKB73736.1 restriction system-associated AAA family ATPase [Pseudomonas aeruginosa]HCH7783164.1 restriction system-associated AAA family ATPase [Pseudomonas aeruginosa]HEP9282147.1 restriction system-associated AAA family ATPase [Pseudomonas aeruginosa]
MKLLSLRIDRADTCGGLLDGLYIPFRDENPDSGIFDPLCLVGPNGTGKSQLLQVIAEIFQAVFRKYLLEEEHGTPNDELLFEINYLVNSSTSSDAAIPVRIYRKRLGKRKPEIVVEAYVQGDWTLIEDPLLVGDLLPSKVIGYTSGDNETLSLPFFSSRAGYAGQVRNNARDVNKRAARIRDPRLLLIDYGTNLEVLVANLLLNPDGVKKKLLETPNLKSLRSFRCIVQLKHSAAPSGGVKLTQELEDYISYLKRCATCYENNEKNGVWIFDFFVNGATHEAFGRYWRDGAFELYSCFHKLAMLNDLIIPKAARDKFDRGVKERRFASRLPEPLDEQKVFRFEQVEFVSNKCGKPVDYVSLSDGEHQLAQLLGMACMADFPNALFLLDEPESHFNPLWRVEFIKTLRELPTKNGSRTGRTKVAQQECLLTTHSPFVPSDMQRENVLIFKKSDGASAITIRRPQIQTYGSRFDAILSECFEISPPISALSRDEVARLFERGTVEEIKAAIDGLGESAARMRLAAKLSQLESGK